MAHEVVLDANVIVGWLDSRDALSEQANRLSGRLRDQGAELVFLDFLVAEALSVLCRRARERKTSPPDLGVALNVVRGWFQRGEIRLISGELASHFSAVLDVVEETGGALNVNDALIVVLQREGTIGEVASFDERLDMARDFRRIS